MGDNDSDRSAFRAALDQQQSAAKDLAPVVAAFWKKLIEEGMAEDAATEMTASYLTWLLMPEGD